MCTHILMAAERDPTVMIGGTLPLLHAGHRVGAGDTIVMEACEYYNSLHAFSPTVAVILNIEADHLDFFQDLEDVKRRSEVYLARAGKRIHHCERRDKKHPWTLSRRLARYLHVRPEQGADNAPPILCSTARRRV